jgi:dipeptidyl aminopeptidase/acylaminoacyl peptidase
VTRQVGLRPGIFDGLPHLNSKPGQPQTFAVVNTDGTGYREIAKLDGQPYCWPTWSWDNRYLVCAESQDGSSRLLRISVADGQTRELLSLKTGSERASFSPDGRFVAYQVQPTSEADPVSRIFIVPAEGGEPQLVYEERQTGKFSDGLSRASYSIGPPTDATWPLAASTPGGARLTCCQSRTANRPARRFL